MSDEQQQAGLNLRRRREHERMVRRRRRLAFGGLAGIVVICAVLVALVGGGGGAHHATDRPAGLPHSGGRGGNRGGGQGGSRRQDSRPTLAEREGAALTALVRRRDFITAGGTQHREIALTFDDGPGPYTYRLLQVVRRLRVPVTFFEIGFMMRYFNDPLEDELHTPNVVIGDHTMTHPFMAHLSYAKQQAELIDQTKQLAKWGGPFPRLFRPPYGSFNQNTFKLLRKYDMLMVLWTVDTDDYEQPGVKAIVQAAVSGARPGAIILMHDGGGVRNETIAALPTIVRELRARGYTLVTVPQLVLDNPPPANQPLPENLAGG